MAVGTETHQNGHLQTAVREAAHPKTPVAGPYGHPFHPILVTVPIGAWIGSLLLDIGSRIVDDPTGLGRSATWLIGLGVVGALLAAVFGLLDFLGIKRGTPAFKTGVLHMLLNVGVTGIFFASFLWRTSEPYEGAVGAGPIILSVVALTMLGASGWLGGKLTYRFGVRVVEEPDREDGFRR